MIEKEFWRQMEKLAKKPQSSQRDIDFMFLLKDAYDNDMCLIVSCTYHPINPELAQQHYMEIMERRLLICFTSKERAQKAAYNASWDMAGARDIMNNMFNKDKIMGMVFNPNDTNMIIVLKDLLLPIMPEKKPKPEFYKE